MIIKQYSQIIENILESSAMFEEKNKKILYKMNEESKEQEELLKNLKQIVENINELNSLLIVNHPLISSNKHLSQYFKFYNNLIASKMKHFFFREKPYGAIGDLDSSKTNKIILLARKIIISENENTIKEDSVAYFLYIFLMLDFLYSKKERKGFFTSFKTNYVKYNKISEYIKKELEQLKGDEKKFRVFSSELIANVINQNMLLDGKDIISIEKQKDILNLFDKYIERNISEPINIEPITYYIAYDIWKHGNLLHRLPDNVDIIKDKYEKYKAHITSLLSLFEDGYKNNNIPYGNIFETQSNLISSIRKHINTYDSIPEKESTKKEFLKFCETKEVIERQESIANYDIETLIQKVDIKYFNFILKSLFNDKAELKDNTALLGSYSSGAFLAILYLLLSDKNIPVFLFKAFPFVDVYPIVKKKQLKEYDNFLIFDDIARTGFTFSIIKNLFYRLSGFRLKNYKLNVFKESKYHETKNIYSLNLSKSYYPTTLEFSFNNTTEEKIGEKISKLIDDKKIDFTFFLTDKYFIYYILVDMTNEILKRSGGKKIALYAPSPSGRVLMLLIAYLLKNQTRIKIKINQKKEQVKEYYKVAVDLSINTKFTIEYNIGFLDFSFDEIDMICVIKDYSSQQNSNVYQVSLDE